MSPISDLISGQLNCHLSREGRSMFTRNIPIYFLPNIFGQYQYICNGTLDSIAHIIVGIGYIGMIHVLLKLIPIKKWCDWFLPIMWSLLTHTRLIWAQTILYECVRPRYWTVIKIDWSMSALYKGLFKYNEGFSCKYC